MWISCVCAQSSGIGEALGGDLGKAYEDILGGASIDDVLKDLDQSDLDKLKDMAGDKDINNFVDGFIGGGQGLDSGGLDAALGDMTGIIDGFIPKASGEMC